MPSGILVVQNRVWPLVPADNDLQLDNVLLALWKARAARSCEHVQSHFESGRGHQDHECVKQAMGESD